MKLLKNLKSWNIKLIGLSNLLLLMIVVFFLGQNSLISEQQKNQKLIDKLLKGYEAAGAKKFNAKRGHDLWVKKVKVKGKRKSCVDCHLTDITKVGKHSRSGKRIEPMSAWTQPDRYTTEKKVEKWFKRNCKGTWGRECTPQEKGDFLVFLRAPFKAK